jgi:hypothetical protein
MATILLLSILSPLIIATITRPHWDSKLKLLIAFIVVCLCTIVGQLLDGQFNFPFNNAFYLLVLAAFGSQQGVFSLFKDQFRAIEAATSTSTWSRK